MTVDDVMKSSVHYTTPPSVLRHVLTLHVWGGVEVVGIKMSGFEVIDGDSIITIIDLNCKVFISPFDDLVQSIIWVYMGSSR